VKKGWKRRWGHILNLLINEQDCGGFNGNSRHSSIIKKYISEALVGGKLLIRPR
jgi:hypothetical protein